MASASASFEPASEALALLTSALSTRPTASGLEEFLHAYPHAAVAAALERLPADTALRCFLDNDDEFKCDLFDDRILHRLDGNALDAAKQQRYWKMLGYYAQDPHKTYDIFSRVFIQALLKHTTPGGVPAGIARLLLYYHAIKANSVPYLDRLMSCVLHWHLGGKYSAPLMPSRPLCGTLQLVLGEEPTGGILYWMHANERLIAHIVISRFAEASKTRPLTDPGAFVQVSVSNLLLPVTQSYLRNIAIASIAKFIKDNYQDQEDEEAPKRLKTQ